MSNCRNCPYNETYSVLSDICDHCQNDPDTGWGGFTDHRLERHFYSEKERDQYSEYVSEFEDDLEDE